MTALFLYDDARARLFEPFALTRPVSELIAGTRTIRERWALALGIPVAGTLAAPHLRDFEELDAPPAAVGEIPAGSIVANARAVPSLALSPAVRAAHSDPRARWECGGRVAAVRLVRAMAASDFTDGTLLLDMLIAPQGPPPIPLEGRWLENVWDLIGTLPDQLAEDITRLHADPHAMAGFNPPPAAAAILGSHKVRIAPTATIEPYVVFDSAVGPIHVGSGSTIRSFTQLVGPCYVGRDTVVGEGRIVGSSFGDDCRIHGDLNTTVFMGHGNKAHEGFLGHSYVGRWVNLGAGTTTSNLKNTYGTVQVWTPSGLADTGLQFLGTLFGDHAKTGIGVCLTTGTVIGAGANVYGSTIPPKVVSPFAWGDGPPYATFDCEKFLVVAERMMARRHITLGSRGRRQLIEAYDQRWSAG